TSRGAGGSVIATGIVMARSQYGFAMAAALLASFGLAGCESMSNVGSHGTGVAELATESPQEASTNIASLTEVIKNHPNSAVAYNTRGVAYARIGRFQEAV